MAQYQPEVLKRLHECELQILRDFLKVCEDNNLTCFGFAGTGIGAIRHGGFIPWDDDIDIGILRKDYNKLVEVFKRDFADKYTVVDAFQYDNYPVMNTHIVLNDSEFVTDDAKGLDYPQGIFLDVFPFDCTSADEAEREKHIKKAWFLSKILIMKHVPFPVLGFKGFKAKLCHAVTFLIWLFLNIFPYSHKFLLNKIYKCCTRYSEEESGAYFYSCSSSIAGNVFMKDDFYPLEKLKFEDVEIPFPHNIDSCLRRVYGDYMQLPPEDKRVNHCPIVLKFPEDKEK